MPFGISYSYVYSLPYIRADTGKVWHYHHSFLCHPTICETAQGGYLVNVRDKGTTNFLNYRLSKEAVKMSSGPSRIDWIARSRSVLQLPLASVDE